MWEVSVKVKILVDKNSSVEEASEALEKAMKAKKKGSHAEEFLDPAMNALENHARKIKNKILKELLLEVFAELDTRYEEK